MWSLDEELGDAIVTLLGYINLASFPPLEQGAVNQVPNHGY